MLSPDEAKTLWERIERGPCSSHLAPEERQWIDLMKAVGKPFCADMARARRGLACETERSSSGPPAVSDGCGMAGYLAQGKRGEASALWNRYPKDVDRTGDVGLKLLYAHAFELE